MLAKSSVGGSTGAGSMDPVLKGGPWTESTWVVHEPGSVFCIRPGGCDLTYSHCIKLC